MWPDRHMSPALQNEYNAQSKFELERIRDFLILHYNATARRDTEFWKYCGTMSIPDSLASKIDLFRDSGRFFREGEEMFALTSWVQVMIGQGILPRAYHPMVDALTEKELVDLGESVRSVITRCVGFMPGHEQFIDRYCRAPAAA
jgi:tryptophan halogenase